MRQILFARFGYIKNRRSEGEKHRGQLYNSATLSVYGLLTLKFLPHNDQLHALHPVPKDVNSLTHYQVARRLRYIHI